MRILPLLLVLAVPAACSRGPVEPCAPLGDPAPGAAAFHLPTELRRAGATVEELGYRLDLTVLSAPTEVLRVNGEEVLQWRYCSDDLLADDLGRYGVGSQARTPPVVPPGEAGHLFARERTLASYAGEDAGVLALLVGVMGPELELPPEGEGS